MHFLLHETNKMIPDFSFSGQRESITSYESWGEEYKRQFASSYQLFIHFDNINC